MNYYEGNQFFFFLFLALLIGFILKYLGKNIEYYILGLSLAFAAVIYGKNIKMLSYLIGFIIFQYLLVLIAQRSTNKKTKLLVILSIVPLIINKIFAITHWHLLAFIGISYMSFKTIQIMLEISDGLIKGNLSLLTNTGTITYSLTYSLKYMYLYTFYLFFDFAGYSLMAVGSSNILGISTPMNFNKPFLSIDIKDFWNRWHISLSTWLRDFVFSRVFMEATKKKRFKKRLTTAMYAYMVNMALMGFWHGLTISYIIYGFYHGALMAGFEYYQKKSKFYKVNRNKTWYKILSWFITINLIMIGLYIFSGEPYKIITTILKR